MYEVRFSDPGLVTDVGVWIVEGKGGDDWCILVARSCGGKLVKEIEQLVEKANSYERILQVTKGEVLVLNSK